MIVGIGTDIIEISRIKDSCSSERFLNKIYTKNELELFNGKNFSTLAGNFAAKEAVVKAMGCGFNGVNPIEVEILRSSDGRPYVNLYGNAKTIARGLNISFIHVSISHNNSMATAYVIAEEV